MRETLAGLPWELLGQRAVMVTLTYPGDWTRWCPDGEVLEHHRRVFYARYRARWGPVAGVWAKEFQRRGAPHLVWVVWFPRELGEADWRAVVSRTRYCVGLQRAYGAGWREYWPKVDGAYGWWLRAAWADIVTSNSTRAHHAMGVDVRAVSYGRRAPAEVFETVVAVYIAKEVAKARQKRSPGGFGPVGRWWAVLGREAGFRSEAGLGRRRVGELEAARSVDESASVLSPGVVEGADVTLLGDVE